MIIVQFLYQEISKRLLFSYKIGKFEHNLNIAWNIIFSRRHAV